MIAGLLALIYLPMLIEAARAARHERIQRARGGVEPIDDVYRVMRVAYPLSFAVMLAEGAARGLALTATAQAGLVLFLTAKALKWWAILALGRSWTFRVIVVPGDRLVGRGPYRWLRHPNYVGVAGELAGAALMAGAPIAGPVATLAFGALIVRRIRVEERTLRVAGDPEGAATPASR